MTTEVQIGQKVKQLRAWRDMTLRQLAESSGLSINTLSLIENGRTSPSVSTLQQLAAALNVPIGRFFEEEPAMKPVVFTPANQRPAHIVSGLRMENLGKDLRGSAVQPFVVELPSGCGGGERGVVHTGHELIYLLEGSLACRLDDVEYRLEPGDSLLFEAHLPHCWQNPGPAVARFILVLYPADQNEEPAGRHFSPSNLRREKEMKIAVITDDGKTISQHFGRANHYLVVSVENGQVVNTEMRDKQSHHHGEGHQHEEGHHHDGSSEEHHNRHVQMADAIADCSVLLAGGMGAPAYESMRRLNIQPIVTTVRDIQQAVEDYIAGKLVDHTERLH